jgi:hypothetical protein
MASTPEAGRCATSDAMSGTEMMVFLTAKNWRILKALTMDGARLSWVASMLPAKVSGTSLVEEPNAGNPGRRTLSGVESLPEGLETYDHPDCARGGP